MKEAKSPANRLGHRAKVWAMCLKVGGVEFYVWVPKMVSKRQHLNWVFKINRSLFNSALGKGSKCTQVQRWTTQEGRQ